VIGSADPTTLRLTPPLTLTADEAALGLDRLAAVFESAVLA